MIKYAIAGNIASGKSAVENILIKAGEIVTDTDQMAHKLLENNLAIIDAFKEYDICENGKISREKLGKLIFSDIKLKNKLENILHPQIKEKILEFFKENNNKQRVFVSIPLVFEAGMEDLFDKIIFIYTNDDIRLQRLVKRNNYTGEYAKLRMDAQQSQDEKIKKSDIVIYNNSTLEELEKNIKQLIL